MKEDKSELAFKIEDSKNLVIGTWQWGGEFFRAEHRYPKGSCLTCGKRKEDPGSKLCEYNHGGFHREDETRAGILEKKDCEGILLAGQQNGVTCIDTAADYGAGKAETWLGGILSGARSQYEVFPANTDPRLSAALASTRGLAPSTAKITVFSKVLPISRTSVHEYSQKIAARVRERHAAVHEQLWQTESTKLGPDPMVFVLPGDLRMSIHRTGDKFEGTLIRNSGSESWMHVDELCVARQILSSDHRLCGALASVCLHSFDTAQTLAARPCWWEWLRILRDEFGALKYYGASARTPDDCKRAAKWEILDYISVPFNALTYADYREVLAAIRRDRPGTVILARETLASGFLTGHYADRETWRQARRPSGREDLVVDELQAVYGKFDQWKPFADVFKRCADEMGLPLGTAGALFALGSGLFDGVTVGWSSLQQARTTLDRWERDRDGAPDVYQNVVSSIGRM